MTFVPETEQEEQTYEEVKTEQGFDPAEAKGVESHTAFMDRHTKTWVELEDDNEVILCRDGKTLSCPQADCSFESLDANEMTDHVRGHKEEGEDG